MEQKETGENGKYLTNLGTGTTFQPESKGRAVETGEGLIDPTTGTACADPPGLP